MVTFRVAEDSTGTSEDRWLDAFHRRDVPPLRLEPIWDDVVVVSAHADDAGVEAFELPRHPFFLATSFQPQVGSSSRKRLHPVLRAFGGAV